MDAKEYFKDEFGEDSFPAGKSPHLSERYLCSCGGHTKLLAAIDDPKKEDVFTATASCEECHQLYLVLVNKRDLGRIP